MTTSCIPARAGWAVTAFLLCAYAPTSEAGSLGQLFSGTDKRPPSCEAVLRLRAIEGPLLQASNGDAASFARLRKRMDELNQSLAVRELQPAQAAGAHIGAQLAHIQQHQEIVLRTRKALDDIRRASHELLEPAEKLFTAELIDNAPPARLAAVSQLAMLTQRLGRSAAELSSGEQLSPEAVFLLGKDTNAISDLATGLLEGNAELRLRAAKPGATRQPLTELMRQFTALRTQLQVVLSNVKPLVEVREARAVALADSAALERNLDEHCTRSGGGTSE